MKVSQLIEQLQRDYSPDTELYVEYWDKEIVENFMWEEENPPKLTDDEWGSIVEAMENSERLDQSMVADSLVEEAESVMAEREEE